MALENLTPRELEVLEMLAKGYDNIKIADILKCAVGTVAYYLTDIYGKLALSSEFDERNKRVTAARVYLKAAGQLSEANE